MAQKVCIKVCILVDSRTGLQLLLDSHGSLFNAGLREKAHEHVLISVVLSGLSRKERLWMRRRWLLQSGRIELYHKNHRTVEPSRSDQGEGSLGRTQCIFILLFTRPLPNSHNAQCSAYVSGGAKSSSTTRHELEPRGHSVYHFFQVALPCRASPTRINARRVVSSVINVQGGSRNTRKSGTVPSHLA